MKQFKDFWIYKGDSKFCNELEMGDEYVFVKSQSERFYNMICDTDTGLKGTRVIEYSAYENLKKQNDILIEALNDITNKDTTYYERISHTGKVFPAYYDIAHEALDKIKNLKGE